MSVKEKDVHQWNFQKEKNYAVAIRYYEQKQRLFFNYYKKQYGLNLKTEVFNHVVSTLNSIWAPFCEKALKEGADYSSYINRTINVKKFLKKNPGKTINDIDPQLIRDSEKEKMLAENFQKVLNAFTNQYQIPYTVTKGTVNSQLGNIYEYFLADEIKNEIAKIVRSNIETIVSGNIRSKSFVTKNKSDIRNDILIYDKERNEIKHGKNINKAYSINKSTENIQYFELQNEILLDNESNYLDSNGNLDLVQSSLNKYLNEDHAGVGGLNLKYWETKSLKKGDYKRFSNSSVLGEALNKEFARIGKMNFEQAEAFNAYFVSGRLINIISPTTIGFFSGDGYKLTSDFLRDYYLFFKIKQKEKQEGFWQVGRGNIIQLMYKKFKEDKIFKALNIYDNTQTSFLLNMKQYMK